MNSPVNSIPENLLLDVQLSASKAVGINPRATFQFKLPVPRPSPGQVQVIPGRNSTMISGQGAKVSAIEPKTINRNFEMSQSSRRPVMNSPQVKEEPDETFDVDPNRLTTERGSYTVEQLRSFLGQLGLSRSGPKADLVARVRHAYGLD